jgi:uncharacterized protein DUF4129
LLAELLAAALPPPDRDPGAVQDAVREVLSRPEYTGQQPSLLERGVNWLLEQIGRILAEVGGSGRGSVIGVVVFLLLLAGVAFVIVRFSRGMTLNPERAMGPAVPRRSATDWRALAERNEQAGDWRGGLRCRYRALVADLAARGLVDEVPGTTAGDFAGATELFELAWYGNRPTGPEESSRFRGLADRVLAS